MTPPIDPKHTLEEISQRIVIAELAYPPTRTYTELETSTVLKLSNDKALDKSGVTAEAIKVPCLSCGNIAFLFLLLTFESYPYDRGTDTGIYPYAVRLKSVEK